MMFDYRLDEGTRVKRINAHLAKQKIYDTYAAILASIGWVCELGQCYAFYEQIFYTEPAITLFHRPDGEIYTVAGYEIKFLDRNESTILTLLRLCVTISTVFLLFCIYQRYGIQYQILLLRGDFYKKLAPGPKWIPSEILLKKKMILLLILELFYLSIHSPPLVNANFQIGNLGYYLVYSLDLMIFVAMQGRIYLLVRLVKHYSPWLGQDAAFVCKNQGAHSGFIFGYKAFFRDKPMFFVMGIITVTTVVGSIAMMQVERPYEFSSLKGWYNFVNALWCGFSFMSSVGYGDIYPATNGGRITGLFVLAAGQFLTSLMVAGLSNILSFFKNEENAYYKTRFILQREKFIQANKDAIKYALLYYLDAKIRKIDPNQNQYYTKMQVTINKCRNLRRIKQNEERSTPFNVLLNIKKLQLGEKKFDVIRAVRRVELIRDRVASLETKMTYIEESADYLHRTNSLIHQVLEDVKDESTVEEPFDALVAAPQALRHFDRLKKGKKQRWINTDSQFNTTDLEAAKNLLTLEKMLRRRLIRRINTAQTIVDKELVHLTSDKAVPALTFHDKRELVKIEDAKQNLKNFAEKKKQATENVNLGKRAYVSGPQLMEKLRKKAHLVKLSLRMRTQAMKDLAKLDQGQSRMSSVKESSTEQTHSISRSQNTPSLSISNQTPEILIDQQLVSSSNEQEQDVLDLLHEEDEDSVLGSDLDDEENSNSFSGPNSPNTGLQSMLEKKPALKKSKYGMAKATQQEKASYPENSLSSLGHPSQEDILRGKRFSYISEGFGRSEEEIKELETLAKALNTVKSLESQEEREPESDEVVDNYRNRRAGEIREMELSKQRSNSEKILVGIRMQRDKMRRAETIRGERPSITQQQPFERVVSEESISPYYRGTEREYKDNTNTNATLITQENETYWKDSGDEMARHFASPGESIFRMYRRTTETDDSPISEFGTQTTQEPLYRRDYRGKSEIIPTDTSKRIIGNFGPQQSNQVVRKSRSNTSIGMMGMMNRKESTMTMVSDLELSPALRRQMTITNGSNKPGNSPTRTGSRWRLDDVSKGLSETDKSEDEHSRPYVGFRQEGRNKEENQGIFLHMRNFGGGYKENL